MKLPFTIEQFFNVIEKYNLLLFPFQLIILILGIGCIYFLHSRFLVKDKLIGIYISVLWIWIGIAYHFAFFTVINKAAFLFGGVFVIQGLLTLFYTFRKDKLNFSFSLKPKNYLGYFFILYGLIFYPIISFFVEGSIEKTISIGLPCPSTIFTFGFFILASNKFPKCLLIIPSLWAIVGLSAAINIGVIQDIMIIIAAITADILLIKRRD